MWPGCRQRAARVMGAQAPAMAATNEHGDGRQRMDQSEKRGNRGRASQRGAWRARCSRRGPEASGSTTAFQRPKVEEDEDGELPVRASLEEPPGSAPRRRRARARRQEPVDTERRQGVADGHAGRDDGVTTVAIGCGAALGEREGDEGERG